MALLIGPSQLTSASIKVQLISQFASLLLGTYPTCHDFNTTTITASSCGLLVGFSAGQIQLIDPFQKEFQNSRLFNEDRLIDKSPVTCLKWVPSKGTL
jgi:hypothetical protein